MTLRHPPGRQTHGGFIRRLRSRGEHTEITDFSASLNPFPPQCDWNPASCDISDYPDDTYTLLKETIGRVYSRDPSEIAVGNGSVELIRVYAQVMLGPGKTAFIEQPTFGEYIQSVILAGGSVTDNPSGEASVRYLCNPNNPTGLLKKKEEIMAVLSECNSTGSALFLDEAFIDLSDPDQSLAKTRDPDLFVLQSLTKSFAVPGIRFGFGFGDPLLIDAIEKTRPPWTVNRYAETFAIEALSHLPELGESRRKIAAEREYLADSLQSLGFSPHPSHTNYILVDTGKDAGDLTERLLSMGVLVRDCTSFGLVETIRVAVRTREENRILIEALAACAY